MTKVCPKCGGNTRMQVQATISAPSSLVHQLSKQNLRSKEVYLMGVNWETADFICENQDCQHITDGYGNYVTKLEKANMSLVAELTTLKVTVKAMTDKMPKIEDGRHDTYYLKEELAAVRELLFKQEE